MSYGYIFLISEKTFVHTGRRTDKIMRQIRQRFILVAMSSTFIVLFAIMSVIFFVNYRNLEERADAAVDAIVNKDTKEEKGQADEFQRGETMSELRKLRLPL